jgi:phosphoenolpyruvate carboxykinase (GTP)
MATLQKNTIFTNVLLKNDGTVWWEGGDGAPPAEGTDWKGNPWHPNMVDTEGKPIPGANANSRFTAPASQCPSIAPNWEDPGGVPISAFIFGGRRARVAPLVYESFDWQHGVFVGGTMASERTAAQYGTLGEVRRDPMAMLPFCGYNMADYFAHWLNLGKRLKRPPRIFHVNWFRTDDRGKFVWPGFGENLRVLEWIVRRCRGEATARQLPIGYVPETGDIDITGLGLSAATMDNLLSISRDDWTEDTRNIEEFFAQFGDRMPKQMWEEFRALKRRLGQA